MTRPAAPGKTPVAAKRIVFMGSPDFAIPALDALAKDNEIVAVYTQPPRPAGRGMHEQHVPVAKHAIARGFALHHPATLKTPESQDELAAFKADIFVVVAYGLILPAPVLAMPRFGCINGHASLLPRWRGAAPIQRAIAAGDSETGISAMLMEAGLDTGPVLARRSCKIESDDTAGSLHDKLAIINASLLADVVADLPGLLDSAKPQDENLAIYAPKISTAECEIDWHAPLAQTDRQIRAFSPFPGTWFNGPKGRLKIHAAKPAFEQTAGAEPGSFLGLGEDDQLRIATADGVLDIHRLQPAGKKPMSGRDFLNGQPLPVGYSFTMTTPQGTP